MSTASATSALERLLRPAEGDVPADYARRLLDLRFGPDDLARYADLSERAQLGTLTSAERTDLEDLLAANDVLMILRAKARVSLGVTPAA